MMYIAWDIETCPTPLADLTEAQRRRYDKQLRRQLEKTPEMPEEDASRLVRSTHPALGWICCISVSYQRGDDSGTKSYFHHLRSGEQWLLAEFWRDVNDFRGMPTFVTFNGKRFDVPFLRVRSWANGLQTGRRDLLYDYPYKHKPHCDLFNLFPNMGLNDVCDLLGVASPKSEMSGADVAPAVQAGRIADVVKYCEADVRATLDCYSLIQKSIVS